MLQYKQTVTNIPELTSYIINYTHIFGNKEISKTIVPRSGMLLVINLAGLYRINGWEVPESAVFGIHDIPLSLYAAPGIKERIQVMFAPGGMSRFSHIHTDTLLRRIVPAEVVFPGKKVKRLIESFIREKSPEARSIFFDNFFADLYSPPDLIEQRILDLAQRLCHDPDVFLSELLREIPLSLRQAERLFARLVGLSPRSFARIARFELARNRVEIKGEPLLETALSSGYYDQPHFGRDFKRFAGTSPGSYSACPPVP